MGSYAIPTQSIQSEQPLRLVTPYGSTTATNNNNTNNKNIIMMGNKGIAAAIIAKNNSQATTSDHPLNDDDGCYAEEDLEAEPTWSVFVGSIGFIVFGVIALIAGFVSIFWRH